MEVKFLLMAPDRHLEWCLNVADCQVRIFIPTNFYVNDLG